MSWVCCAEDNSKMAYHATIKTEFQRVDPKTQRVYEQLVHFQQNDNMEYAQWRRTKLRCLDYDEIRAKLKNNQSNFKDLDFPHENSMLSKQQFTTDVEWMRAQDAIPHAVFSKEQGQGSSDKIKLSRRQFEHALVLLGRAHPETLKELLSQTLNPQGIYKFKIFHHGVIQSVIVDDYIPMHDGLPLFVGPARGNEVYPILLEKAIAKVCGSYENIPEDVEIIMQMISCGPVSKLSVAKLKQNDKLQESIQESLAQKDLTVLLSRRDGKVRNYGINENEIYHVLTCHNVAIGEYYENAYELISENKMAAFNGRFSLTDEVWKDVTGEDKQFIFSEIKRNRSFCIGSQDIGRLFQELLVFQGRETANRDWLQDFSENQYPCFMNFVVKERDRIFVRVSTNQKIWQSLILAKLIGQNSYRLVIGKFAYNQATVDLRVELDPGEYIICIHHEWLLQDSGNYAVFLSSRSHIRLSKRELNKYPNFLVKLFAEYESRADKSLIGKSLYSLRLMVEETGFAYLYINPRNSKSKMISVLVDKNVLDDEHWQVREPDKGRKQILVSNDNLQNSDKIIILRIEEIDMYKKVYFPATAFKIKE